MRADPVQEHLGEKLRAFYEAIVAEPVPERLRALLDQLEQQERTLAKGQTAEENKS